MSVMDVDDYFDVAEVSSSLSQPFQSSFIKTSAFKPYFASTDYFEPWDNIWSELVGTVQNCLALSQIIYATASQNERFHTILCSFGIVLVDTCNLAMFAVNVSRLTKLTAKEKTLPSGCNLKLIEQIRCYYALRLSNSFESIQFVTSCLSNWNCIIRNAIERGNFLPCVLDMCLSVSTVHEQLCRLLRPELYV
jgi:hypothetical protein